METGVVRPGSDIEAWCTTCKDMKWHVVVAVVDDKPAKVECNGCHKQHQFRAQAPGQAPPRPPSSRAKAPAAPPPAEVPSDLEERLRAGEATARAYAVRERFAEGDLVRHPQFGVGLVIALPALQKMEVAFKDGRKLLVHDRGQAAAPPGLTRPARVDDDAAPRYASDAPPPKPPSR
jgi:hypothetical protein